MPLKFEYKGKTYKFVTERAFIPDVYTFYRIKTPDCIVVKNNTEVVELGGFSEDIIRDPRNLFGGE